MSCTIVQYLFNSYVICIKIEKVVRKQSQSEVMICLLDKDEDNVWRPVRHAPAKILCTVALLNWVLFSSLLRDRNNSDMR